MVPPVLIGLGAVGFAGSAAVGLTLHGKALLDPPVVPLPLSAGLYSAIVWPLVWGFVEEATYNGYAAPRAQALSSWLLVVVCLGWAAQHLVLPLLFDAAFLASRFVPVPLRGGRSGRHLSRHADPPAARHRPLAGRCGR